MRKGNIFPQKLMLNDSNFIKKSLIIQNTNYLHDKIREDKERLYARIYFVVSLALTLLASFYIGFYKWHSFLILITVLNIMILLSLNSYRKKREKFWKNRDRVKKSHEVLGLEWID